MTHFLYSMISYVLPKLLGTSKTQRLSILNYHRVMLEPDPMRPSEPTVEQFDWQMKLLSKYCTPLSLSEGLARMDSGSLPPRAVCVTFDDGYADNEEYALPVLQRWGVPATVFVTTGYLNGGRMWNDTVIEAIRLAKGPTLDLDKIGLGTYTVTDQNSRVIAADSLINEIKHWAPLERKNAVSLVEVLEMNGELPSDLMMTHSQLKNLSNTCVDIGAHTETHPILATLDSTHAKAEIQQPKAELEKIIGRPIEHFAYPNGKPGIDYREEHRDMAKMAGYVSAVSTQWGVADKHSDRWQLPRFTPWDKTPLRFLVRLLLNFRDVA